MKIAITTDAIYPFTLGGSEIRNHEIAKRLVKMGHEVHIFGGKFWKGKDIIEIEGVKIHGVGEYSLYGVKGKRKPFESFKLTMNLFLTLLDGDFDIIDNSTFVYFNCYATRLACWIKRKPLVFTWHQYFGKYLLGYFGKIKGLLAMILERASLKLSNNHIAVSNHVKGELIKRGVPEKDIKVIYNGADMGLINSIKEIKSKYELIFVGRLNYQKNITLLIESIRLLKKDLPKIKVCVVGNGQEKDMLSDLVNKYQLSENFDFVGAIKDKKKVFEYMKSAKIFVLPSLLEGFPLTIVEANACGLPVITTKTKYNNTLEYIKHKDNGLVSDLQPANFANSIKTSLTDKKLYDLMSKNSILKAKDFNWDFLALEQEKFYKEILSR